MTLASVATNVENDVETDNEDDDEEERIIRKVLQRIGKKKIRYFDRNGKVARGRIVGISKEDPRVAEMEDGTELRLGQWLNDMEKIRKRDHETFLRAPARIVQAEIPARAEATASVATDAETMLRQTTRTTKGIAQTQRITTYSKPKKIQSGTMQKPAVRGPLYSAASLPCFYGAGVRLRRSCRYCGAVLWRACGRHVRLQCGPSWVGRRRLRRRLLPRARHVLRRRR